LNLNPTPLICENFLNSFKTKIENSRGIIPQMNNNVLNHFTPTKLFNQFELITFQRLREIVSNLKPTGSAIDMVPPWFLKENIEAVGPSILQIVNKSLAGIFPSMLKKAFCTTRAKKIKINK